MRSAASVAASAAMAVLAVLATISAVAQVQPYIPVIGMSSSFDRFSPLLIPRGGIVFSDSLFLIIYNHADHYVTVELNYTAPPGISIIFHPSEQIFEMGPNSYRRIVVEVRAAEDIVPGPYEVIVTVSEVREAEPGKVVVIPAVSHTLRIIVEGEYGYIDAVAVDPAGNLVREALVRLYRVVNGTELNILDSRNGSISARVVPGEFIVRAYLMGDLVAEKRFTLEPYERENVTLVLQIVFFERFSVIPVLNNETGDIISARLRAVLKNVYRTLNDTRIVLVVRKDGKPLENRTVVSAGTLPVGRTTYEFDYVPPQGWLPGNYTFRLVMYGLGNRVLAVSDVRWVFVRGGGLLEAIAQFLWAVPAAVAAPLLFLVYRRSRRLEIVDAWIDPYTKTAKAVVVNRGRRDVTLVKVEVRAGKESVRRRLGMRVPGGSRARISVRVSDELIGAVARAGKGKIVVFGDGLLVRASASLAVRES